ncbi:MAG: hypothetical protein RLZZ238_548 [Planctomycetota bacterium]
MTARSRVADTRVPAGIASAARSIAQLGRTSLGLMSRGLMSLGLMSLGLAALVGCVGTPAAKTERAVVAASTPAEATVVTAGPEKAAEPNRRITAAEAAARDSARLRTIVDARWDHWTHGAERISADDLDDEAADASVRGEEAAVVASLIQQLNRLRTRESIEAIERSRLAPVEEGGDEALWRALLSSYRQNRQKARFLPTELWAQGEPSFGAVRQAREGDCWLLASTGWIVRHRPELVRTAIEPAGENRWRVRFASGETVEVFTPTTTELLAVNSAATLRDGLWLPIVKEAMGTLLGETNARKQEIEAESLRVNGGSGARMLQRWTGHKVRVWRLEGRTPIDKVRAALVDGVARKAAMGAGTPREPAGKIPPNHALGIFGFDAERDVVILWNPWWNTFTPKGPEGRENGYACKAGIMEMPLADFVELFRGLWIETDEPLAPRG